MKNMTIVVTGDICLNRIQWVSKPSNPQGLNWQKHNTFKNIFLGGGALLLANLVRLSTNSKVISPSMCDTECELIHSALELGQFPKFGENSAEKVYRVQKFLGFSGPDSADTKLLDVSEDDPQANMVIIDDDNNGFNMHRKFWPLALSQEEHRPIVIYKMNKPAGNSNLWFHLDKFHKERTIVVINSEDMRSQGVNISKSLSWEKTAEDFVWQINHNPNLSFLNGCRHLVVPFGLEGCIYYQNHGESESVLHFIPYEVEGDFSKKYSGEMYGLTSCFVAALARYMVEDPSDPAELDTLSTLINEGIKEGMVAAQNYFIEGFGKSVDPKAFPFPSIFHENNKKIIVKEHVQDVKIPGEKKEDLVWNILDDKSYSSLVEIAYNVVKFGAQKALGHIPIAGFGHLKTVDRMEIESYRSINNLMREYIATENTMRPLSIAVFGTPGSGKSFGVTEVATSIAPGQIVKLTFNLSQFNSTDELVKAFHIARDYSLQGKLPLLIFDEFDSDFRGELGWLKYFLAPMQDGMFREGENEHPIGKAIFVFSGGTSSTFDEFSGESISETEEKNLFNKAFRMSKGFDFISRLRGYVNILGPNPVSEQDSLYVIRRAMMLRSLIIRKAPHLINENRETQIDNGVLRALLKVPRFKHETRSMEAILDMSMVNNAKKWEQSHLPSQEQLKLHVDEESFMRHLMHDAFFSEKIEMLAAHLYGAYMENKEKPISWENISKESRAFYMDLARNIPEALLCIKYDIVSCSEEFEPVILKSGELELLAQYEHTRWLLHKKNRGWKHGETFSREDMIDPYLLSYSLLPKKKKEEIVGFVSKWTGALAKVNYTLCRS